MAPAALDGLTDALMGTLRVLLLVREMKGRDGIALHVIGLEDHRLRDWHDSQALIKKFEGHRLIVVIGVHHEIKGVGALLRSKGDWDVRCLCDAPHFCEDTRHERENADAQSECGDLLPSPTKAASVPVVWRTPSSVMNATMVMLSWYLAGLIFQSGVSNGTARDRRATRAEGKVITARSRRSSRRDRRTVPV